MRVSGRRHAVVHARAARWDWLDAFFRNNNRKNAKAQCLGEKDGGSLVGVFFVCAMACDRRQEPRNGFFFCWWWSLCDRGSGHRRQTAPRAKERAPTTNGRPRKKCRKEKKKSTLTLLRNL
ncbi:hypothetical protein [Pandoravirus japonicus]|uniref:Uncharacterized protein n=1 Tax=Pandoravirus japonicus TaxID=2823154 RepID=A0A811BQF0_9VIRU|nr:hypothetical protein [Pandoravirus japonicus]